MDVHASIAAYLIEQFYGHEVLNANKRIAPEGESNWLLTFEAGEILDFVNVQHADISDPRVLKGKVLHHASVKPSARGAVIELEFRGMDPFNLVVPNVRSDIRASFDTDREMHIQAHCRKIRAANGAARKVT